MNITPDHINGTFEVIGGLLLFKNVKAIIRDKKLSGVSWQPVLFFSFWGLWNLYYYPGLDQWWSFAGGIIVVTANCIWLSLIGFYTLRNRGIV